MVLQEYKPGQALAEFVRTFRLVNIVIKQDGFLPVKPYPPKPEHCLSFYARDRETVEYQHTGTRTGNLSSVIFGQQTEVTNRYVGNNFLLIQVVFKPGALYRLTGIPSQHLTNQYIDAQTIFSKEIKTVNNRINDCHSFTQMIKVVEQFLLGELKRKCQPPHTLDISIAKLFSLDQMPSVDFLARASYQSNRSFERHFLQRMGVSPKYFLKVMRFENAFRMKNKYPQRDWFTIAISCGYYDYQHLVKDYKELTGLTPNQFHEVDLESPERLFGEADTY